ncbi:MAG: two-component system, OmpR family, sensor histidine kinase KdpD [Actinomycetota bacterium]|nr:two-component system, OmpR family, sensor histidine kinase KdpD [Actinomycetota bacterium]
MRSADWAFSPYRRPPLRAGSAVVATVGAATLLRLIPGISTSVAALVYVLAVVAATAVGGQIAGLVAAPLSFLALNFFFTPPRYTFEVSKTEDLLALGVFLVVALTVGTLLSLALSSRDRMQLRELEARLMTRLSTHLLSGEPIEEGLQRFAAALVELFDLSACEIETVVTARPIAATADQSTTGERLAQPIVAKGRNIGTLTIVASSASLSAPQREAAEAFARQMAVALEGIRLSDEARGVQLEVEATKLRAALFSSVTHDLRTPLGSITTAVTSLLDPEGRFTDEQITEHLETIRDEAERLNRLVGNLLDLSRIRSGALVPAKVEASIDEVIESVLRRLRAQLDSRELQVEIQDNVPDIPMDVMQIDQVVTNLVENAVKFSYTGSPISVTASGWDGGIRVRVANLGERIKKEDRERLFEAFVRGETPGVTGTGLGLAIAKAIVVAHGGRIWIDDAPAGGTAVAFELPAETG